MQIGYQRLLLPACVLLLAACQDRTPPSPPSAPPPAAGATAGGAQPGAAIPWSSHSVWNGDLNACRKGDAAATRDCLLQAMRTAGASAAAISAAEQVSSGGELGHVSAWHPHEGIGVATVEYPFRANTNQSTRLVDAAGKRIDVDADPTTGELAAVPAVRALLASHPGATLFAPAQSVGSAPLDGGGVRLIYQTPLRDCHACADVAMLKVGYDFDAQRRFVGMALVE